MSECIRCQHWIETLGAKMCPMCAAELKETIVSPNPPTGNNSDQAVREWQIEKSWDHRHISGPSTLGEHGELKRIRVVDAAAYDRVLAQNAQLITQLVQAREHIRAWYTTESAKVALLTRQLERAKEQRDEFVEALGATIGALNKTDPMKLKEFNVKSIAAFNAEIEGMELERD